MPSFSFEKISAPVRLNAREPAPVTQRRGFLASLLDRMAKASGKARAMAHSQKHARKFVRFETSAREDERD